MSRVTPPWFDELAVLSELPGEKAVTALRVFGEERAADRLETALLENATELPDKFSIPPGVLDDRAFMYRGQVVGHLGPMPSPSGLRPIRGIDTIEPDATLRGDRLTVGLDAFYAADYPGGDRHRLLFHFATTHHVEPPEQLHMSLTRPIERQATFLIVDRPLFAGLAVGEVGIDLRGLVLPILDARDQTLLEALDTEISRLGLRLLTSPQPVATLFSDQTFHLTETIRRRSPAAFQDFDLGLGIDRHRDSLPLALGTYVVLRVPRAYEITWDWEAWCFEPATGRLAHVADPDQTVPYNYLVFTVDRFHQADGPPVETPSIVVPAPPSTGASPDLEIRVRVRRRGAEERLVYELRPGHEKLQLKHQAIEGPILKSSLAAFRDRLVAELDKLASGVDPSSHPMLQKEIEDRLADIGHRLYDELIPFEMRQIYLRVRHKIRSIQIISDEPWIPWELVKPFDRSDPQKPFYDDFLSLRFELTRWLNDAELPAREIRVERLAALNAGEVPGIVKLPEASAETVLVRQLASARAGTDDLSPTRATGRELEILLREGRLGLLHVIAHGEFDLEDPEASRIYLTDRQVLRPDRLRGPLAARLAETRPLVFLSACEVGRQSYSLTGLGGWPRAWIDCGCGAFVAPQWTVKDCLMFEFVRGFYGALGKGATFGQAALAARRRVHEIRPGSPAWMAPAIYAHPHGRLAF